ncbi:MAG: transcription termination/antitermination protein NusA [Selenomonadaceae bacterium]|nr:transcription termination/antitermination protein NusA [Selenomonadaceae bacterium]
MLLLDALKDLCREKDIAPDLLFDAIESALAFAYKKTEGAERNVEIDLDRDTGIFHIYEVQEVVSEVKNPLKEISLEDAREYDPEFEVGEILKLEVMPSNFGRIAAQAAKQFVLQKIREAERGVVYDEYTNLENDIISGVVTKIEEGSLIIDLDKTEAILPMSEQMRGDKFKIGDKVRAYIAEVKKGGKGPQVYLSRTHPGFLKKLFEMEVPEIQEGIVVVKAVAREPGIRSKIAVFSNDENIDAIGSCVGPHGIRVQAVVEEIGAEKIDIIQWDENPALFVAASLSPARVFKVGINEFEKNSRVIVPDNQLSLAIGREGQNARLAARLTGWKIDIKSREQAQDETPIANMKDTKVKTTNGKAIIAPKKKKKKKKKNPQQPDNQKNVSQNDSEE